MRKCFILSKEDDGLSGLNPTKPTCKCLIRANYLAHLVSINVYYFLFTKIQIYNYKISYFLLFNSEFCCFYLTVIR